MLRLNHDAQVVTKHSDELDSSYSALRAAYLLSSILLFTFLFLFFFGVFHSSHYELQRENELEPYITGAESLTRSSICFLIKKRY